MITRLKKNWILILTIVLFLVVNIVLSIVDIPAIDFSESRLFSISDRTKEILKTVNEPITFYVYSNKGEDGMGISEIMEVYQRENSNILVEYVGADMNELIAKQYRESEDDLITVVKGNKSKNIKIYDMYTYNENYEQEINVESELTTAILTVNKAEIKKIAFIEGHDEYSIEQHMTLLRDSLRHDAYDVSTINLVKEELPSDVDLLVSAGATYDLTDIEKSKVEAYMNNGGNMLVIKGIDDIDKTTVKLDELIASYGATVKKEIVIDKSAIGMYGNALVNVMNLAYHQSNQGVMSKKLNVISDIYNRPIGILDYTEQTERGIQIDPIIISSEDAYVTTVENFSNDYAKEPVNTTHKSYNIGVISTKTIGDKTSKMIVIGNSSVCLDSVLQISLANDEFLNELITWSVGAEKIDAGVESKLLKNELFAFTQLQGDIMLILIFIIPIAIIIAGIVVVVIRRKK